MAAGATLVVAVPEPAFAGGSTFQGKLTITGGGGSSVSDGDNNCRVACGYPNGSQQYCATPSLNASLRASTGGSVTISMGTTTSCTPPGLVQNHLAGNTTYDINFLNVDALSPSDVVINDYQDCISPIVFQGVKVATALTNSSGAFTKTVVLPPGQANSPGWSSAICVSTPDGGFGNEAGIRFTNGPQVSSVSATSSSRQVRADWPQATENPTSYDVALRRSDSGATVATASVCATCLSFTFTQATNGLVYKVAVTPRNGSGPGVTTVSSSVTPAASWTPTVAILPPERRATNPSVPRLECTRALRADPVDTASGMFSHTFDDLAIPGRGVPLAMSHTYNSDSASLADGPLGYGWSYPYGMTFNTSTLTVTQESGAQVVFSGAGPTYAPAASRTDAALVRNGDGTYTFTRRSTEIFVFDASGALVQLRDRNGYVTTVTRPNASTMVVTDPAGRSLSMVFANNHLQTVTDANVSPPRTITFRYLDGQNNLNEVVDVTGGITTLGYDSTHRLTTMRFPRYYGDTTTNPSPVVTNHYDATGRVDWQSDELGRTTTFVYNPSGEPSGSVKVTDPKGNAVLYRYEYGLLSSQVRGYGTAASATWLHDYDPLTLGCTRTTDPLGRAVTATYDAHANRLTSTDALNRTTTWTYNGFNQPMSVTDPSNVTTTVGYDGTWGPNAGNLITVATPLKDAAGVTIATRTSTLNYFENGNTHPGDVTSLVDPNAKRWVFGYDSWGNRNSVTDPLQHRSTSGFDAGGRMRTSVSARGNAAGAIPGDYTTTYDYEADNLVNRVTDPLGHVTQRHYDANRNLDWMLDADQRKTAVDHDPANQVTAVTRGAGTAGAVVERSDYWPDGAVYHHYDADNKATTYNYDVFGNLDTTTDPLGRTTTTSHDPMGNLTKKQDPGGSCSATPKVGCTTYGYDVANELKTVDYSEPATPDVTNVVYDANGRRSSMTDATGTSNWTWDSLGRMTSSTTGAAVPGGGQQVGYAYQLGGELSELTYPGGQKVTRHFDDAGNLDWVRDWLGNQISFGYDADNNWQSKALPAASGVSEARTYDRADRLMSMSVTKGAANLATFAYGRSDAGLVASLDASGVPDDDRSYTYDLPGRLCLSAPTAGTCATPPVGATPYGYDTADNLARLGAVNQGFDPAHQLCWSGAGTGTCAAPPAGSTRFGYDLRGNRISLTPATGPVSTFTYDQANRLKAAAATAYTYNGDGLRMAKSNGSGTVPFSWDEAQGLPLLLSEGPVGTAARYLYGPGGLPVERVSPTGGVTYYHQDQLGSTRLLSDESGNVVGTYTYDPYGQVAARTGSAVSQPFQYAGEYSDAETGFQYLRARYYDPATGQFLTRDPIEVATRNPYGYTAGNPLIATDPSGLETTIITLDNGVVINVPAPPGLAGPNINVPHPLGPEQLINIPGAMRPERQINVPAPERCLINFARPAPGGVPKPPTGRGTVPPSDRDPVRLFPRGAVSGGLGSQGGTCLQCGEPLDLSDARGHHVIRHADGGETEDDNLAVLCPDCHTDIHRR